MKVSLLVLIGLLISTAPAVNALEDVTPGKSLEGIRLGTSPHAACKVVLDRNKNVPGWKHSGPYRLHGGLVEDDLVARLDGSILESIEVLSRNGVVVQVSRTVGVGLSQTDYSFAKLKQKHSLREQSFGFDMPDGGGFEGFFFDDVAHGICFSAIVQDVFLLTTKPHTLSIHKPGVAVIPIIGGVLGKRDLGEGGRVYADYADYSTKAERKKNDY